MSLATTITTTAIAKPYTANSPPVKCASGDYHLAHFSYLSWQKLYEREKPYELLVDLPKGCTEEAQRTNMVFEPARSKQCVRSVRGREHEFDLDVHGFAFRKHATPFHAWTSRDEVAAQYVPEMERFLQRELSEACRMVTYDWRIRNSARMFPKVIDLKDPLEPLHPATQPHVDCSLEGCQILLRHQMGDEADQLMRKRYRIINIWRPIKSIKNWPLAVCDSRTVDQRDLITADRVRKEFVGEGLWSLENPGNEFFYLPDQEPDEVILLKIADSDECVQARNCVHAAFDLGEEAKGIVRESIEMRVFVFTD